MGLQLRPEQADAQVFLGVDGMKKEVVNRSGGRIDGLELATDSTGKGITIFHELLTDERIGVAGFDEQKRLLTRQKFETAREHLSFVTFRVNFDGDNFVGRKGKLLGGQEIIEARNLRLKRIETKGSEQLAATLLLKVIRDVPGQRRKVGRGSCGCQRTECVTV